MIQTKLIALTPMEYFKIILGVRMRKSWWLYLSLLGVVYVLIGDFGKNVFATFLIVMAFLSPIITVAQLYFYSVNPKNKIVFIPRKYNFSTEEISMEIEGKEGALPLDYIVEVKELSKYWLLYISVGQFLCIPKKCI